MSAKICKNATPGSPDDLMLPVKAPIVYARKPDAIDDLLAARLEVAAGIAAHAAWEGAP
ncbi:MAG: hypothetical protein AAGA95_01745 [Pseudomonadota bacterium]